MLIQEEVKEIYVWEDVQEWQPTANTVAYYPLTAQTTVNDMKTSGTKYNLTNYGVTFGTYQGVSCAYFQSGNYLYSSYTTGNNNTILVWAYLTIPSTKRNYHLYKRSGTERRQCYAMTTGAYIYDQYNTGSGYTYQNLGFATGEWCLIARTDSGSTYTFYAFVNGVKNKISVSGGADTGISGTTYIGGDGGTSANRNGYISEYVEENRAWTEQEIQNYYLTTKSNYGY